MSRNVRIIARLDVKAPNLVKGVQLEGLRKLGNPHEFAKRYYQQGIDEILYIDIVASLYERNGIFDLVRETTNDVFIPITVGGGLRTLDDIKTALRSGADKVAINTAAIKNPKLITEAAECFGSQCIVISIEAKSDGNGKWEALYDNGRERSRKDVISWAKEAEALGAGEILLTSIDQEGSAKGFDIALVREVSAAVEIPVIASGGMSCVDDFSKVVEDGNADAVAIAHLLHYNKTTVADIRMTARDANIPVRHVDTQHQET